MGRPLARMGGHTLLWHTAPGSSPPGTPTATRGGSTATTDDAHYATARLSVRLSVHSLPTQRCPVIPFVETHSKLLNDAWLLHGAIRTRRGLAPDEHGHGLGVPGRMTSESNFVRRNQHRATESFAQQEDPSIRQGFLE